MLKETPNSRLLTSRVTQSINSLLVLFNNDAKNYVLMNKYKEPILKLSSSLKKSQRKIEQFLNLVSPDSLIVINGYYGDNLNRLVRVKEFNPNNSTILCYDLNRSVYRRYKLERIRNMNAISNIKMEV